MDIAPGNVVEDGVGGETDLALAEHVYVSDSDCELRGALTAADFNFDFGWPPISLDTGASKAEIMKGFDLHPNADGTEAQANAILEAL